MASHLVLNSRITEQFDVYIDATLKISTCDLYIEVTVLILFRLVIIRL